MNPYKQLGLSEIINAAGKMTYLGSSSLGESVIEAMSEVARGYVDMERLKKNVGERTAEALGAEAACVTACCAAGIAVSIAAVLTGENLYRIESLPKVTWKPSKIIVQKGHMVNFGANIEQAIRMTGAEIIEIGTANSTKPYHLEGALDDEIAGVVHVISHHTVQNGMLGLENVIEIAHSHHVPVIVDAAAETDLTYYTASGADLVVFSGHKAIGGPTSGVIVGKEKLVRACQMQDKGLARMMKVGKENIVGFYFALEEYLKTDERQQVASLEKLVKKLKEALDGLNGIVTRISWDATRPIPRLQMIVEKSSPLTPRELIVRLEAGNPSIRTRNHLIDERIIQFDPREMKEDAIPVIKERLENLFESKA